MTYMNSLLQRQHCCSVASTVLLVAKPPPSLDSVIISWGEFGQIAEVWLGKNRLIIQMLN